MLTTILWAALGSSQLASAAPTYPAELTRPTLEQRFKWPKPEVFTANWKHAAQVRPVTILELEGAGTSRWFIAAREGDTWELKPAFDSSYEGRHTTSSISGDTIDLKGGVNARVVSRSEEPLSGDALVAWSYVNTLLETNRPRAAKPTGDWSTIRTLVDELSATKTDLRAWAKKNSGDDVLFETFETYVPFVTCGNDSRPTRTARVFAELAWERGDLVRFLREQLVILNDGFLPFSSRDETVRLSLAGIQLDTFLIGAGLQTADQFPRIESWQLVRTIHITGRTQQLLPKFEALAQSPSLDAVNRLMATQVWVHMQRSDHRAKAKAKTLSLHPLARAWLDSAP